MNLSRTNAARLCTGLILAAGLSACAASPGAAPAASTVAPPAAGTSSTSVAVAPSSTATRAASVVVGKGAAVKTPQCTHSSCAHITATTTGFPAAVTCTVAGPDRGTFGVPWQQGANETKESPNYYGFPGTTVAVTCTGDGRTASGSLTW